jgi:hypothetical protein
MLVRQYLPKSKSPLGIQSQPLGIFDSKPNDGLHVTDDVLVPIDKMPQQNNTTSAQTATTEPAQAQQTPPPIPESAKVEATTEAKPQTQQAA